jgi:hypothetical protein
MKDVILSLEGGEDVSLFFRGKELTDVSLTLRGGYRIPRSYLNYMHTAPPYLQTVA